MIDIVEGAGVFEDMRAEELSLGDHRLDPGGGPGFAGGIGEVGSVIGEDGVDGFDEAAQELRGGAARHFLMQFDEGELRRPINGDDEMELALSGSNLGDVDMEIADRVSFKFTLGRRFAFDLWQPRDPVALKAAMQRRVLVTVSLRRGPPSESGASGDSAMMWARRSCPLIDDGHYRRCRTRGCKARMAASAGDGRGRLIRSNGSSRRALRPAHRLRRWRAVMV